jgi:hypothetical protein
MADHVGDRLLRHPVGRHLDARRQDGAFARQVEVECDTGRDRQGPAQLGDCAEQAELVDGRWAQAVDDPPDLRHGLPERSAQCGQPFVGRAPAGEQRLHGVDLEPQPGERGAEPVVQVVAQPPALLLPGEHELFLGAAQVLHERRGVHHSADLVGEGRHQVLLRGSQRPPAPGEHADLLAVRH